MSSLKKFKLWFFVKIKLYIKKILKKDVSINREKTNVWELLSNIVERLSVGKKPPEEIILIAKFKELKDLILSKFKIMNIKNVIVEYNKKILNDCFNISVLLKDMKLVSDFLKLLSNISINNIIENRK